MEALIQTLRHAARRLARTPTFTLIALTTLAIAVGASTAAFSLVNGVLLKPLGFERPDRLVYLHATEARQILTEMAPQDVIDYQNQTHSFTAIVPFRSGQTVTRLRPKAPPLLVNGARVGADFFSVLGTHAQLGRTFAHGEDARTATRVLVLSDGAWHRYFAADPGVIGTQVRLDGDLYVVVGMALPRFTFPDNAELWYPAVWADRETGDIGRGNHVAHAIARLRDGVTLASAQRDLSTVASRIAQQFPKQEAGIGVAAVPIRQGIVGDVVHVLTASATLALPRMQDVGIDIRVLAFAATLAVGTGAVFGLIPALHASGWDVATILRSGRGTGGSAGSERARSVLVFAELALGTVLLVGAGRLIRSFQRLTDVDPGFRPDHLVAFDVALSGNKYENDPPTIPFFIDKREFTLTRRYV